MAIAKCETESLRMGGLNFDLRKGLIINAVNCEAGLEVTAKKVFLKEILLLIIIGWKSLSPMILIGTSSPFAVPARRV